MPKIYVSDENIKTRILNGQKFNKNNLIKRLNNNLSLLILRDGESNGNLYSTSGKNHEIKPKKYLIKESKVMKVIEVTHPIQEDQLIKEDVAMAFGFLMACIVVIIKCLKHWMNVLQRKI